MEEELLLPNGRQVVRQVVHHPGAVVIIPKCDEGSLLLVSQYRHGSKSMLLEFPAGTLNKDEDPLDCAKRELMEEIEFAAFDWIDLGIQYPSPGFCDEVHYIYLALNLVPQKMQKDEDEIIDIVKMDMITFEKEIICGNIVDAKTIASYTKAKLQKLL